MKLFSNTQTWVTLVLSGHNLKPDEINTLGIMPDYFHSPFLKESGELIPGHWQLNSNLQDEPELEVHLLAILKKIAPIRKELKELLQGNQAFFYCSLSISKQEIGGFGFSTRVLSLLVDLNIAIQIFPNYLSER